MPASNGQMSRQEQLRQQRDSLAKQIAVAVDNLMAVEDPQTRQEMGGKIRTMREKLAVLDAELKAANRQETPAEFCSRHGGNPVEVDGLPPRKLLPDGAFMVDHYGAGYSYFEPIPGIETIKARRQYWQVRLGICENGFHTLRAIINGPVRSSFPWKSCFGPEQTGDPKTDLGSIQKSVLACR